MAFIKNQDAQIYWDDLGRGAPVLLIMGLGWASNMWHRTRPLLASSYYTVALDNRGAGRSEVPPGPYSIPLLASDAAAVLDAVGVERAHLIGASMGGMIAQEFALQYPHRVRSLTLVCTAPGGPRAVQAQPEVLQALFQPDPDPAKRAAAVVPFIYDESTSRDRVEHDLKVLSEFYPNPVGYAAQLQAIMAWEAYSRLPQISAPTLVVHGDNDRLVPPGNADLIAERIPGAKLVKLPDASHILMTDQPAAVHGAMLDFLAAQSHAGIPQHAI
jgi:pimeloyl-ACP methyl ester carboxylesterase